jgi:sucrose-6-phosphatase
MHPFLLVTDLDHTLVGDPIALAALNQLLRDQRQNRATKLVYATGRSRQLYNELAQSAGLLEPDVLITAVGSEIYHSDQLDQIWADRLSQHWNRDVVVAITQQCAPLTPQPASEQLPYKVSFFLAPDKATQVITQLRSQLANQGVIAQLIYSSDRDLDILPQGANKGKALTYVREQLGFAPHQTIACGDSGNDIALFGEHTKGIIVGNARPELRQWHEDHPSADHYLAKTDYAAGILEGLAHFGFSDRG